MDRIPFTVCMDRLLYLLKFMRAPDQLFHGEGLRNDALSGAVRGGESFPSSRPRGDGALAAPSCPRGIGGPCPGPRAVGH